jgi:hypothetical protein
MRLLPALFIAAIAASPASSLAQTRLTDQIPPWEEQDTAAPARSIHAIAMPRCLGGQRATSGCRRGDRHRASFSYQARRNRPL